MRCYTKEIKTKGDRFLATFDAPARFASCCVHPRRKP
jgi:hypothetical protein